MTKLLVAIVGRPNVGKSTLFNRMTSRRDAIVLAKPGVTRDRHYGEVSWDGLDFRIVDTAGLEWESPDLLQQKMNRHSLMGVEEADLIVCVMDGRAGLTPTDSQWIQAVRKLPKNKIYVVNKVDDPSKDDLLNDFYEAGVEPLVAASAETGRGTGELLDEIVKRLREDNPALLQKPEEADTSDKLFKISIMGRPNVGKSTLTNRLLGIERSIVHDAPGTTRDPVDSLITYEDEQFVLVDTAGIRKRGKTVESVEKFSIIKALDALEKSHMVLFMLNAVEGITEQDAHVLGEAYKRGKALIILVNKWDEAADKYTVKEYEGILERKLQFAFFCPVLFISAKTGKNVDKLFPLLLKVKKQYEMEVSTSQLNGIFEDIVGNHPLPVHGGKDIKIYYATQIKNRPPTFVVFSNHPDKIHFSYQRYLQNALRDQLKLPLVPVRILFRKRK